MNYPDELLQKMHAAAMQTTGNIGGIGALQQAEALRQIPQRDESPVFVSVKRLFDRLGQLNAEVDMLTSRLAPVSRPEPTGEGKTAGRAPTECDLVEMLGQAADRIEHLIGRIGNAQARLCI